MKRIFTYGGLVTDAIDDEAAKKFWGLTSYVGLFDITYGLSMLAEARLGPWPHDGMMVHLTPEDLAAIKASEEDQRDAEWWRVEAHGLAERLNAAVLSKQDLGVRLGRLDNLIAIQRDSGEEGYMVGMLNGLLLARSVFDDKAPEFKTARPDVGVLGKSIEQLEAELQEIQAKVIADEDEIAAQVLKDAEAFIMKHPMDPDEVAPSGATARATSPAIAGEEGVIPPPVDLEAPAQESPMSFEAPTDSLSAARNIMRHEWPAGTPTLDIIALMQKHVPGAPSWATNKTRLGIEAARLGLKRPAGFRATLAKAAAVAVEFVTPVPEMASRVRKAEPPKATVITGPAGGSMVTAAPVPNARIMGVGQLPPAPPKSEPVKAPALAISAQSAITKSYGPFVEKLHLKGLSFDDIKRRMNKELPRDFTREDVALIVTELGL